MRISRLMTALVAFGMILAACGDDTTPNIANARIGQPTGPNGALYFTAGGYGEADRLIGASADVADRLEVHETVMGDNGTMGMRRVESLDLSADGSLVLEPGGRHVMLMGVDRLEIGTMVDITLQWENAGDQVIQAEVVSPADTDLGDD